MTAPLVFAHRGRLPGFRENTIDAFVESGRRGADGVELDVRRSADGALVVHHDPEVDGVGVIADVPVGALPRWIPLLDQVLDACVDLTVNVEVKNDPEEPGFDDTGSLAQAVAGAVAGCEDRVMFSCFHLPTLDALRSAAAEIPTAWLTVPLDGQVLRRAADRGHSGVNPLHLSLTEDLVGAAHDLGLSVATWTVDEPERMTEVAGWGVDIVFTNQLELALKTLRA